ncbi:MAG: type II secretion system protein GspL [Gammaproteobacteria bacterium]|nr:type II secretion system protein GspL [Gammaproteobacteria bacterium]
METLLVQPDQNWHSAQWLVLDESGQPHAAMRSGTLEQLKDFSQQRRVVCLLDGCHVQLEQLLLPAGRNRRKLLQAIPFALEDDLADDLDDLHFALGKESLVETANDNDADASATRQVKIPVAIVAREKLRRWLQMLAEVGIKPHVLLPGSLALPLAEHQWHVLIHDHQATVRTGPQSGFSCDLENLAVLLDAALDETDNPPQQIQIWNHSQTEFELTLQHTDVELIITKTDQAPLATLARGFRQDTQINLLQGEFGYKQEYGKLFKYWAAPAMLLGGWLLLVLITQTTTYFHLKGQNNALEAQMIEIYKQVFPNSKNFTNPRQQLKTKLDSFGGGGDSPLLQLLNAAASQIHSIPNTQIQSLDFNGEFLDLELAIAEVQQLEQMRQQLQNQGLSADIKSANTEGDRVIGKLRLGL